MRTGAPSMVYDPPFPLFCGREETPACLQAGESSEGAAAPAVRPQALVIDDEHIIADTIAQILEMSGFEAVPLYSGEAALEQALEQCPDVVISDVVMPGVDGIETAKRLLERCPSAKILLLSGQAASAEMIRSALAEGYSFELLPKPLHPEDLLAALRRLGF